MKPVGLALIILGLLLETRLALYLGLLLFILSWFHSKTRGSHTDGTDKAVEKPQNNPLETIKKPNVDQEHPKIETSRNTTSHSHLNRKQKQLITSSSMLPTSPLLSPEQRKIYENLLANLLAPTHRAIFVTGPAGTGKTTLLYKIQETLKKNVVTLAPTGIAALQAQGQTIHSFFRFPARLIRLHNKEDVRLPKEGSPLNKIIRALDTLVIDEVSMVRVDVIDAIDWLLKQVRETNQAFGGIKVILFGDLRQLEPVVAFQEEEQYLRRVWGTPFFFSAYAWENTPLSVYTLKEVHRQKTDPLFIEILNQLRKGDFKAIEILNEIAVKPEGKNEPGVVILTPRRREAEEINLNKLHSLPGKARTYNATIEGDLNERDFPTESELVLKKGVQVVLLKNDPGGSYFNGDLGWVEELGEEYVTIRLKRTHKIVYVRPHTWDKVTYGWNQETNEIEPSIVGSFRQLPVKLAWAMTIHKAQGLTIDRVHIELGDKGMFAHGQLYVALSRVRSLNDLSLSRPIRVTEILWNAQISLFEKKVELEGVWYRS